MRLEHTNVKGNTGMDERVKNFLKRNHFAVMSTLKRDGTPHSVIVGVGLVDGRLWSSGTLDRVRTKHLRRDNRASLCVLNRENPWSWLTIESRVTILDGPDAVDQNQALYEVITGGPPENLDEYRKAMVDERRIVYEFSIDRTYGSY
jgi:PPOX class probable F420-dependent enzyme